MTPALVFDIETIPDVAGLRSAWDLADQPSDDAAVADRGVRAAPREQVGHDFLPLHLHRVVAIGLRVPRRGRRAGALPRPARTIPKAKLVQDFFRIVDRYTPQLVSWNGGGFDLPVLHYRGLVHGVQASRYWEQGDEDREFKWNNYQSRYHARHLDLMDVLARYTPRANAPLDELAKLCGFPGKLGMDGSQVWAAWRGGGIGKIRDYCETDVANTWLLYCRFMLISGQLTPAEYDGELALLRGRCIGAARRALDRVPGPGRRREARSSGKSAPTLD